MKLSLSLILLSTIMFPSGLSPSFFLVKKTKQIEETVKKTNVEEFVFKYAILHDVDPKLILAVIHQESKGKQSSISKKGAIGIMQLMPKTARWLKINPYSMEENIAGGIYYLAQQLKKYKNIRLALAAYNAGPGAVDKYDRTVPPYRETRNYVRTVCERYLCDES